MLDALTVPINKMTLTPTGIDFGGLDPSKEELDDVLRKVKVANRSIDWIVGDALIAGMRKGYYGESYKEAIELTGMTYQRLLNCYQLAKNFEFSRRRENLPVEHHRDVIKLKTVGEQDQWLDCASKHQLSHRQLKASIDAGRIIPRKEWEERGNRQLARGVVTLPLLVNRIDDWLRDRMADGVDIEHATIWLQDLQPVLDIVEQLRQGIDQAEGIVDNAH
jgi:hypothetical protein